MTIPPAVYAVVTGIVDATCMRYGITRDQLLHEPCRDRARYEVVIAVRERIRVRYDRMSVDGKGHAVGYEAIYELTGIHARRLCERMDRARKRQQRNAEATKPEAQRRRAGRPLNTLGKAYEDCSERIEAARNHKQRTNGGFVGADVLPD